jgi:hypothetical protein
MGMPTESDVQEVVSAPTVPTVSPPQKLRSERLGEELPIFCERCGYSLNGLPQGRCADCKILHFHCPECGHRQPINTLRPAVQRILGRLRALWLCFAVLFKLNFFGWLLFAWVAMGVEWSYRWDYHGNRTITRVGPSGGSRTVPQYTLRPRELDLESLAAFGCFGLAFGLVGRMLLLRWRRGYLIGLVLGGLVIAAVLIGARFRQWDLRYQGGAQTGPFTWDLLAVTLEGAAMVVIGAWIAWPIWMVLVKLFLPTRTSNALLEWQKSLAGPVGKLAQE